MKKKTAYSDKYGKIVTEGEVVEERSTPGVSFAPAKQEAAPVAEVVVEEAAVEEAAVEEAPKKKKSKKSDDKE